MQLFLTGLKACDYFKGVRCNLASQFLHSRTELSFNLLQYFDGALFDHVVLKWQHFGLLLQVDYEKMAKQLSESLEGKGKLSSWFYEFSRVLSKNHGLKFDNATEYFTSWAFGLFMAIYGFKTCLITLLEEPLAAPLIRFKTVVVFGKGRSLIVELSFYYSYCVKKNIKQDSA